MKTYHVAVKYKTDLRLSCENFSVATKSDRLITDMKRHCCLARREPVRVKAAAADSLVPIAEAEEGTKRRDAIILFISEWSIFVDCERDCEQNNSVLAY